MGLLSRWTAPWRDACSASSLLQRQGDATALIVKVTSRPQRWRNASDQPEGDHTARADHTLKGTQSKKGKHPPSFLHMMIFYVCKAIKVYTVTHDDCGSLKETRERSGKCPRGFLKTYSKPSGTDCSLWCPTAAASCPSSWRHRRYVETLTLNTASRRLEGTLIMLVICWTTTERSHGTTQSQVKSVHGMLC